MAHRFLDLAFTPSVQAAQQRFFGRAQSLPPAVADDLLGAQEVEFIAARDSFYLASVSETGWPYLQHRGGAPGFVQLAGANELIFADYKGNRQMLTTGNLAANDRVCLFFMDYPQRQRLKILGHAEALDAREHPDLLERHADPSAHRLVERFLRIRVVGYDWNCPKYITPRYTAAEVEAATAPLRARLAELEAKLAQV